jgi:phage tail tape-measure protein
MRLLKRSLPERIWRRLGRHPVLVVSTATMGVKVGQDGFRLRRGEIDAPEFRKRTGGHVGSMSGGLAGAAAGAAWGSALPGLGTVIGAFAGGLVGEELGGRVGRLAIEQAELSLTLRHEQTEAAVLDPEGATARTPEEPETPVRTKRRRL